MCARVLAGLVLSSLCNAASGATELTFDYGEDFWAARDYDPLPESDSRVVRIRLKRALRWLNGPLRLWRAVTASLPL